MILRLDDWFCKYKVTSSDPNRSAQGRVDPCHNVPLFTQDTKGAAENCKEKAIHFSDPMSLDDMYDVIPPNPNSTHQLTEYLSNWGESKLEAFHDRLANFANSGMRDSLSDNLHLAGTARYNLAIRHRRRLLTLQNPDMRRVIPGAWDRVLPHFNHAELCHINKIAADVNCGLPFPNAETLPVDNGERFFSEHLKSVKPLSMKYNNMDECLCASCAITITDIANCEPTVPVPNQLHMPLAQTEKATAIVAQQKSPPTEPTPPAPVPMAISTPPVANWQGNWLPIQSMPMPMYYAPSAACCGRYWQWQRHRKGRPPHDLHCQTRTTSSSAVATFTPNGGGYFFGDSFSV